MNEYQDGRVRGAGCDGPGGPCAGSSTRAAPRAPPTRSPPIAERDQTNSCGVTLSLSPSLGGNEFTSTSRISSRISAFGSPSLPYPGFCRSGPEQLPKPSARITRRPTRGGGSVRGRACLAGGNPTRPAKKSRTRTDDLFVQTPGQPGPARVSPRGALPLTQHAREPFPSQRTLFPPRSSVPRRPLNLGMSRRLMGPAGSPQTLLVHALHR